MGWHSQENADSLTHLLWSDNVYIISKTKEEFNTMWQSLTATLQQNGLEWKSGSLMFLECGLKPIEFEEASWPLGHCNSKEHEFTKVPHLPSLGSCISPDGSDYEAVKMALRKATSCFWSQKSMLLSKHVTRKEKFAHYVKHVIPVLVHSSAMWTWSKHLCGSLNAWENDILRKMCFIKRTEGEEWVAWIRRHTRAARKTFYGCGYLSITERCLKNMLSLARKSSVYNVAPARRLLSEALQWRDEVSWHHLRVSAQYVDAANSLQWKHRTCGVRSRQWDSIFVHVFGNQWRQAILSGTFKDIAQQLIDGALLWAGTANPRHIREAQKQKEKDSKANALCLDDKIPREIPPLPDYKWNTAPATTTLTVFGDNDTVISWLNGTRSVALEYQPFVKKHLSTLR